MNAAVTDLSEYRLHRECERYAWGLPSGLIVLQLREPYTITREVARDLSEALNESLSRCKTWKVGRCGVNPFTDEQGHMFTVRRTNMLGAVGVHVHREANEHARSRGGDHAV